jgi:hypothetical protein
MGYEAIINPTFVLNGTGEFEICMKGNSERQPFSSDT